MRKAFGIQPLGLVGVSLILLKSSVFGYMCGFDPHLNGRTAVMDGTIPKWENNIVKYMFNDSSITKEDKDTFAEAVKQIINANHCLKFTEISSAPHGEQYMLIKRQGACGSGCFAGASCGLGAYSPTVLNLKCSCIHSGDQDSIGLVIHEIFHGLGFHHTQTRPDRDNYVELHKENVAQKYLHKFDRNFEKDKHATKEGPYDCGSIMHYKPDAMIEPNLQLRCRFHKKDCVISGKRKACDKKLHANGHDKMTANDIKMMKNMYKCK